MVDEHHDYDEHPSLEVTNPNAPYYVRTPLGDEQIESVEIDDSEGTTEAGRILGQPDCLPTVEQGSQFPSDPAQGTTKPLLNGSGQCSISTSLPPNALCYLPQSTSRQIGL
jgi:hypothetical protein